MQQGTPIKIVETASMYAGNKGTLLEKRAGTSLIALENGQRVFVPTADIRSLLEEVITNRDSGLILG